MLWTIAVALIAMWLLELGSSYTVGGLLYIPLVVVSVGVLFNITQGRWIL